MIKMFGWIFIIVVWGQNFWETGIFNTLEKFFQINFLFLAIAFLSLELRVILQDYGIRESESCKYFCRTTVFFEQLGIRSSVVLAGLKNIASQEKSTVIKNYMMWYFYLFRWRISFFSGFSLVIYFNSQYWMSIPFLMGTVFYFSGKTKNYFNRLLLPGLRDDLYLELNPQKTNDFSLKKNIFTFLGVSAEIGMLFFLFWGFQDKILPLKLGLLSSGILCLRSFRITQTFGGFLCFFPSPLIFIVDLWAGLFSFINGIRGVSNVLGSLFRPNVFFQSQQENVIYEGVLEDGKNIEVIDAEIIE